MHPILFKIGSISIYSYGVMVALGFGVAVYLIIRRANELNLKKETLVDFLVAVLLGGIAGARLLYVALNIKYYLQSPLEIFNLSRGGLVWYGGFLGGIGVALWYIKKYRLSLWLLLDLTAPYVALAQSFGRIGCFLNGCCYGLEAPGGFPVGVSLPDSGILLQPTQLYSSVLLLSIFVVLRIGQALPHFKGEIFLAYCFLYALKRTGIEFLRGDNPRVFLDLTLSQIFSIVVLIVSITIFIYRYREWKRYLQSR